VIGSSHPEHFTAEAAEIAKVHQGSTDDAKRLDHNVPLCTTYFSGRVFGNEGFLGDLGVLGGSIALFGN